MTPITTRGTEQVPLGRPSAKAKIKKYYAARSRPRAAEIESRNWRRAFILVSLRKIVAVHDACIKYVAD